MPVPYKPYDMKKAVAKMNAILPEESEKLVNEAFRSGREEWLQWLAQYDETGHLKPEFQHDINRIQIRAYGFLSMTHEEQAAYIVSEKKRLGVL